MSKESVVSVVALTSLTSLTSWGEGKVSGTVSAPIDEAAVHALLVEINERLDQRMADYERRQAQRKAERAEFAQRRAYGLQARHAAKLARNRQEKQP